MYVRFLVLLLLLVSFPLMSMARVAKFGNFNVYTVDCGTGLAAYLEWPSDHPEKRPIRMIYDAGKGGGEGVNNDLVKFLASDEIGLKVANGDFEGDIIDYVLISHPHEDHYMGSKPVFDCFDVRNVIESKQSHSIRYLKRFKGPAINEIMTAKAQGKDAHFYLVGLPYPNGFNQNRDGKAYDEYAIAEKHLPNCLKGKVDVRKGQGEVSFPFSPEDVLQNVTVTVKFLMAEVEKSYRYVNPEYLGSEIDIDLLPVGTQFSFGRYGGFNITHGDTIAPFDAKDTTSETYKEAWPYYRECDVNDASVGIQAFYKDARVLIPGDCEGRHTKPTTTVTLSDIFGTREGKEDYTREDVLKHLRRDKPEDEQLPLIPSAERYVMGSKALMELAYNSYIGFDKITPVAFAIKRDGKVTMIPANNYQSPQDIPDSVINWDSRSEEQRQAVHPKWRERVFQLHQDLKVNKQKLNGLLTRFRGWNRGKKKRLVYDEETQRYLPDPQARYWSIVNLVQLTERVFYVDPGIANILAGYIISSPIFLEYMAPACAHEKSLRGEKHMIDVAAVVLKESGEDILDSDVVFFGHHGSFTSSSIGFIHRVSPNVGIISADDKSYAGSTLPDFSSLFWNLNTKHPNSRAILHSIFFHADLLAKRRGEPVDTYVEENRYSASAAKVFRARDMWPIPLWRTDLNDNLINKNTLLDNILIQTNGETPIWDWNKHKDSKGNVHPFVKEIEDDFANDPDKYCYWSSQLISAQASGSRLLRPHDPSGEMMMFDIGGIAAQIERGSETGTGFSYRSSTTIKKGVDFNYRSSSTLNIDIFLEYDDEDIEPEDWTLNQGF